MQWEAQVFVFTEAAAVSPEGRISPGDVGIWKDDHIEMLKRSISFMNLLHSLEEMFSFTFLPV